MAAVALDNQDRALRRDEAIFWIQNFQKKHKLYQAGGFYSILKVDEDCCLSKMNGN